MDNNFQSLAQEIINAVNIGEIPKTLNFAVIAEFVEKKKWEYAESYLRVILPNCTSETHSLNYPKLFDSIGRGLYKVKSEFLRI